MGPASPCARAREMGRTLNQSTNCLQVVLVDGHVAEVHDLCTRHEHPYMYMDTCMHACMQHKELRGGQHTGEKQLRSGSSPSTSGRLLTAYAANMSAELLAASSMTSSRTCGGMVAMLRPKARAAIVWRDGTEPVRCMCSHAGSSHVCCGCCCRTWSHDDVRPVTCRWSLLMRLWRIDSSVLESRRYNVRREDDASVRIDAELLE